MQPRSLRCNMFLNSFENTGALSLYGDSPAWPRRAIYLRPKAGGGQETHRLAWTLYLVENNGFEPMTSIIGGD